MIVFKILLIILVAAPVIGISCYFYSQMMAFIREKNRREKAEIERERTERRERRRSAAAAGQAEKPVKKSRKDRKIEAKRSKNKRSTEQE